MSQTTNLDLTVKQEGTTPFSDFLDDLNGNFEKIDAFAGKVFGKSGVFTLSVESWADNSQKVELEDLGENDAVTCQPDGRTNKTTADDAQLVLENTNGKEVTFTVATVPTEPITIRYFISRGSL